LPRRGDLAVPAAFSHRDGDAFVASCPELDVVSQGRTVETATANLKEAVELFLECADAKEVRRRLLHKVVRQSRLPRSLFEV
jgi:predicted RNase H-like HicB family nuclease